MSTGLPQEEILNIKEKYEKEAFLKTEKTLIELRKRVEDQEQDNKLLSNQYR